MINDSPSHIYHSALPLSPSSSWLHWCYSSEFSQEVQVVRGLQPRWGTCSRTVSFDQIPQTLTSWKDLIAAGFGSGHIITLDVITGIHTSILSGHTGGVNSLAFSSDGAFLVSGSDDSTINLWDVQTGGIIKTFHGNTSSVLSVSVSPDSTIIASGASDHTIHLWDTQTMECCCVIDAHTQNTHSVIFSPTNSQLLISASGDNTTKQQDIDGHQIGLTYGGSHVAFSSDGTHLVSWGGAVATAQNSGSGMVTIKLQPHQRELQQCCFSPDGKLVAGSAGSTIYIWDTASWDPHPIKTFIGHGDGVTSLTLSSSLISSSYDQTIKFWQIGTLLVDLATAESESVPLDSTSIWFVSLDVNNGIAISTDSAGVAKTWDISTGHCKASFNTPIQYSDGMMDARLVNGRLTFVWLTFGTIHTWDSEKGEQMVNGGVWCMELRMSGDGSKVFLLEFYTIQAFSTQTGRVLGRVRFKGKPLMGSLNVDGSRVWICSSDLQIQGWDFRSPGSTPVQLTNISMIRPHLVFIGENMEQPIDVPRMTDTATNKEVFWLYGGYAKPSAIRWDGQYLVASYDSGEVLILDFKHLIPQ